MIESVTNKPVTVTASAPSASGSKDKTSANTATFNPAASTSATPISPRLRYDAVSGVVITEFLDHSGAVQAQAPSSAVMAYLRAGLSKDGLDKQVTEEK